MLYQEKYASTGCQDLLKQDIVIKSYIISLFFSFVVQNANSLEKAVIYISLFWLTFFPLNKVFCQLTVIP